MERKLVGFTGLELHFEKTDEQKASMQMKGPTLSGGNGALLEYYGTHFAPLLSNHGYDPEKHFSTPFFPSPCLSQYLYRSLLLHLPPPPGAIESPKPNDNSPQPLILLSFTPSATS